MERKRRKQHEGVQGRKNEEEWCSRFGVTPVVMSHSLPPVPDVPFEHCLAPWLEYQAAASVDEPHHEHGYALHEPLKTHNISFSITP